MALHENEQYSEYGFLIEFGNPIDPKYLTITPNGVCYVPTTDAEDALRFSRNIDAQRFLTWLEYPDARIAEHCFVYNEKENNQ